MKVISRSRGHFLNRFLHLVFSACILFIVVGALTSQYAYARGFQSSIAYPAGPHPSGVATGDFDGDGHLDLIVVNNGNENSQSINLLRGNGDGTFQRPLITLGTANLSAVVAADFNRDGKLDIAITDSVQNTVSVLLGNGNGTFQAAVSYSTATQPIALA